MQMSEVESVLEKLSSVPSQMPSDPQAAKSAYAEVCQIVQHARHCILHLQRSLARYKAEEAHKAAAHDVIDRSKLAPELTAFRPLKDEPSLLQLVRRIKSSGVEDRFYLALTGGG